MALGCGTAAALQLTSLAGASPASAVQATVPNVTVSAINEWDESTGSLRTVHIIGEFHNNGPLPAFDVRVPYTLNNVAGAGSVAYASFLIMAPNSTAAFEDTWQFQGSADTYTGATANPQTSITVGDAASFAPAISTAVRLPAVLTACPAGISSDSVCGDVTNNSGITVEQPQAVLSYYGSNGTIAAQNVAQAFADDNTTIVPAGQTAHFTLDRTGDPCSGVSHDPFAPCAAPVLSGEPMYPVDVNPATLEFGGQVRGTTGGDVELTVTNNGTQPIGPIAVGSSSSEFAVDLNGCTSGLATPQASCRITVQFTPSVAGSRSGTLTLTDSAAGSPQSVSMTGTGTVPQASVNPSSLTFGSLSHPLPLNTPSDPQSVTVTNTGNGPLSFSGVVISGDFAIQSSGCGSRLEAGASCAIGVSAIPSRPGTRSGSLTVTDNAGALSSPATQTVTLTAIGAGPVATFDPTALHFGPQTVNTPSSPKTVHLGNTGTTSFTPILATTGDFSIKASGTTCGGSINPGASCDVAIVFTPSQASARQGTLTVNDAAGDPFESLPLDGTGQASHTLSPTTLDFGSQAPGTASTKSVTVTNLGSADLVVSSTTATPSSDFTATGCTAPIHQNQSCQIGVTFTPAALGSRPGDLTINYQAGAPDHVSLTGTGAGAESLGSTTVSAGIAATSWGPGRLDVFSRDANGALIHNWWDGSWHGWSSLGGYIKGDPGAVSWGFNRIDVFVRGGDDQLWHKWWGGNAWSGWEPQGGTLTAAPEVASWSAGRLDVFAVGVGGGLWHRWWDGVRWNGWEAHGGQLTSDPGVVSWGLNRIDVFARGIDNAMWHRWWDGVRWNGWEPQGGVLASSPAVASPALGRLDLFALDNSGALMQKVWNGAGWSAWGSLGGSWLSDPSAVSQRNSSTVDVFLRASDSTVKRQTVTP
ncbi:MAG: choice-of-anchor D domain-containing protein [Candidatus Dormibacter sp.]